MKKWLKWFVPLMIGLLISLTYFTSNGLWTEVSLLRRYRVLCDGFYAAAIILLCLFGLIWSSQKGFFDIAVYGFRNMRRLFKLSGSLRQEKSYTDYHLEQQAKPKIPLNRLLFVGLFFLALATLSLFLFNSAY